MTKYRDIWEEFHNKLEEGEIIHHIDLDHSNNSPKNLDMLRDKFYHGLAHGSANKIMRELLRRFLNEDYVFYENGEYFFNIPLENIKFWV